MQGCRALSPTSSRRTLDRFARRARMAWALALGLSLALLLGGRVAAAQGTREPIDVERFKPAVTWDGFIDLEGSSVRSTADPWAFGLALNYALNPLVLIDENNKIANRFVSGRLGADVMASVTLFGPMALGLDIPFFLAQTGDESPSFGGLGDVRLVPKVRLADDRELVGIALVGELRVPTHAGDFSGGARNVQFVPKFVLDHRFGVGVRLGTNLGVALRQGTTFENVNAASEFVYGAALSYRIGGWYGPVEIGAEAEGGTALLATPHLEELPLETRVFAKVYATPEWEIFGGPDMGIVPGYGIPTFRAFLGVRYTPTNHDRDHDTFPDEEDLCPDNPEDFQGAQPMDGCPQAAPPEEADDDQDGVPNARDLCPNEKETINGFQDEDGCPDLGPAHVIREQGKLRILENVEFATGSAMIQPRSYSLLNQVALVLRANPDIKHMRIEGHTDTRGKREMNLTLSDARAKSVLQYLVMKGIRSERLTSKGFGPDRPLVTPEKDNADLQKNRRVEFIIEQ